MSTAIKKKNIQPTSEGGEKLCGGMEDTITADQHYRIKTQRNVFSTWFATTASCGSSGSAAASRACRDNSTVRRVIAAALSETEAKLEQISPV